MVRLGLALCAALLVTMLASCEQPTTTTGDPPPDETVNGPRLALVIGVSAYRNGITPLENPIRDADLVAASLTAVGFQMPVPVQKNPTRDEMNDAFSRFSAALAEAGDTAVGLIYFAGHGIQVRGANYLLPVDAEIPANIPDNISTPELERQLSRSLVPANDFLTVLGDREDGASILVLDACRNNTVTRSLQNTRSLNATRGLAEMRTGGSTLVFYATQPGEVALDGEGRNSPFAIAFAEEVRRPGNASTVNGRISRRVKDATGGTQRPILVSAHDGEFCFTACAASVAQPPEGDETTEQFVEYGEDIAAYVRWNDWDGVRAAALDIENGANGRTADPPAALTLYRAGCEARDGQSCAHLGYLYSLGRHVSQDYQTALAYNRRSCDLDNWNGCANLGVMYERGEGVARDMSAAIRLLDRACTLGNVNGCDQLGEIYAEGRNGVTQDSCRSLEYFMKSLAISPNNQRAANGVSRLHCLSEDSIPPSAGDVGDPPPPPEDY